MAPALIGNNTRALEEGDPEPPTTPGLGRIYSNRFCPFAEKVTLYAAAKGIPVEVVNINLQKKPTWYSTKHPEGKTVQESGIIPEFLDGIYPDSSILPLDPYERARAQLKLEALAPLASSFFGLFTMAKGTDPASQREGKVKAVETALDAAEKALDNDYFEGSSPGYADWLSVSIFERVFLISSFLSLEEFSPSSSFPGAVRWPRLSAWWPRITSTPEFKAAAQSTDISIAFLKGYIAGAPDNDLGL